MDPLAASLIALGTGAAVLVLISRIPLARVRRVFGIEPPMMPIPTSTPLRPAGDVEAHGVAVLAAFAAAVVDNEADLRRHLGRMTMLDLSDMEVACVRMREAINEERERRP
jgi:hypothetical protein